MPSDSATRVLLALILLCLVILVVQGLTDDGGFDTGWGRYQVTGMRAGAPVLIRTDTVTGKVWKLELRGGGDRWVAFHEPEPGEGEGGEPEQVSRESGAKPTRTASAERDIVEPPGAPPLPDAPPRASQEVLDALPPPSGAAGAGAAAGSTGSRPGAQGEDLARLADALGNPELPADMRAWVAKQLGQVDDPAATTALIEALSAAEPEVVEASLRALAGRDDARIPSALEQARASDDPDVRRAAEGVADSLE